MINRNSTFGELLQNPIGRDIIERLVQFIGLSEKSLNNPLLRSVKLKALPKIAPKLVDDTLLQSLFELFNQCEEAPVAARADFEAWWKEAVIYQIYPRSFKDSNGDGIGDLNGVIEKLDYLSELGVTAVWLSPVFDSPNDDNGYDVRDYEKIMQEFGSMADMERLIAMAHARGIRVIMDLVFNHTSDEHRWFRDSVRNPSGPYGDYYIWRAGDADTPPNNWLSFFAGPAWKYFPERGEWAMHLFSAKQMDLNWDNPSVRHDMAKVASFWREKGVDGFRLDVINLISKSSLADGNALIGGMLGMTGIEHYFYGKNLHAYLHQLNREGFLDAFTVGETPGTGTEMNKLMTAPEREELSTVFCFDHIDCPGKTKYDDYRYDLNHLKRYLIRYQGAYADACWPTIFTDNHDNPRMISKIDGRAEYRARIAKLLAVLILTSRGTAFLFQGQEIGAVNIDFRDISEMRDVEYLNRYRELTAAGEKNAMQRLVSGARDHARTPMQWDDSEFAGFSVHEPWIRLGDPTAINVRREMEEAGSIWHFHKDMIALRKANKALVYGTFRVLHEKTKDLFCYERALDGVRFYVEANLSDHERKKPALPAKGTLVASNYRDAARCLRPYEANVYRL